VVAAAKAAPDSRAQNAAIAMAKALSLAGVATELALPPKPAATPLGAASLKPKDDHGAAGSHAGDDDNGDNGDDDNGDNGDDDNGDAPPLEPPRPVSVTALTVLRWSDGSMNSATSFAVICQDYSRTTYHTMVSMVFSFI
jgi:hypothetical protein